LASWAPDRDDDPARFEPIVNTRHGNGSPRAANKGAVKRRFKGASVTWRKNGKKHRG